MILNAFDSQRELLDAICKLHRFEFDLDPTYGAGALHRGRLRPERCFDISPRHDFVLQADCRALPLLHSCARAIAFDPPFLAGGGQTGVMHEKYSSYPSIRALYAFYGEALREFRRVLVPQGFLVFKCQDILNGRTQGWTHCEIYQLALSHGFYAADLFVLVNRNRMKPHNLERQVHARKATCYYWVFKKSNQKNHRAEVLP